LKLCIFSSYDPKPSAIKIEDAVCFVKSLMIKYIRKYKYDYIKKNGLLRVIEIILYIEKSFYQSRVCFINEETIITNFLGPCGHLFVYFPFTQEDTNIFFYAEKIY